MVQNSSFVLLFCLLSPRIAYPTEPSSTRSAETRAATDVAEILRGWVIMIDASDARPDNIKESKMNWGTPEIVSLNGVFIAGQFYIRCVVFPLPKNGASIN